MPSRKQRRRREKSFRHEYETVLLDADGTEHPIDSDELRTERETRAQSKASAKATPAKGARQRGGSRPAREVPAPSWHRALRRGGLMGGLMMLAFVFLFKNSPLAVRIGWGALYAIAFIPLTYWVDRTSYRAYQRRLAKQSQGGKAAVKK
jgi:predicted lipid-binding transport protein (Tim44 family)